MERRRWLCSCAIVTAAAIHIPLRLESDVNQTAAAARESFIYADLVAVAAVEKPDAQACSTSVDLHHAAGETGEVGRYCFHCNKDHVDETYIRCDRCGEIMCRFCMHDHTPNTGCWRWECEVDSLPTLCRVARFKNASATWRNLAAVHLSKAIAAPPRPQTATNSSGVSPPARCGNSETLTPDHLSRSFETLRNEPLTPKTQLDRGVDHNVDELCQEFNVSQEHRKRHLQNQVYIYMYKYL